MGPIKISEEQKEKLLEMCNKLFKEKKNYRFRITDINHLRDVHSFDKIYVIECYKQINKYTTEEQYLIPWFEFCMTYLQDKLKQVDKSEKLDYEFNLILQDSWFESHPVDYLYGQFKKLKV